MREGVGVGARRTDGEGEEDQEEDQGHDPRALALDAGVRVAQRDLGLGPEGGAVFRRTAAALDLRGLDGARGKKGIGAGVCCTPTLDCDTP